MSLYPKQEQTMNHPINFHLHHPSHSWLKDAQFALGMVVAIGGAAVLLSEIVRLFA
jgi:hypothetical protein